MVDLPTSNGKEVANELGDLVDFVPADVTDTDAVNAALDVAEKDKPLRAVVHCAGRGGTMRVLDRDGGPGEMEMFEAVVRTNLIGSFNVLRLAASRMVRNEVIGQERGIVVLTRSLTMTSSW
jgi:NAD(P)-dependent dehydrogenase (short-subunit alcohol dehydrogenase family)